MFIPTHIANAEFQPAQVKPRILFYNGKLRTTEYSLRGKQSSFSTLIGGALTFPYFDHYSTGSGVDVPASDSDPLLIVTGKHKEM